LTIAEVAKRLRVSERTVHRWLSSGELVAHDFGRAKRLAIDDLRRFIAARRSP
jgi:excisionase family DNA binding protein